MDDTSFLSRGSPLWVRAVGRVARWITPGAPTSDHWRRDQRRFRRYFPSRPRTESAADSVSHYYSQTSFTDYRLLDWASGSEGMHTRLASPVGSPVGSPHLMWILGHAPASPQRILEVGMGKGDTLGVLSHVFPGASLQGIDLCEDHVRVASSRYNLPNLEFFHGPMEEFDRVILGLLPMFTLENDDDTIDLIYGVESHCHLDTPAKREQYVKTVVNALSPGGRLIMVDGFRAAHHSSTPREAYEALETAGWAWGIDAWATVDEWVALATSYGLTCRVIQDLSPLALPFWTEGWRVAHCCSWGALPLVAFFSRWFPSLKGSLKNWIATLSVAPALSEGACSYALLVFEKP